jgi:protein-glutamine gamma-glutamyltransferase
MRTANPRVNLESSLSAQDKRKFAQLQLLRSIIAIVVTLFLAQVVDLGIDTPWLLLGVVVGILYSGKLLKKKKSFVRIAFGHAVLFLLVSVIFSAANLIITSPADTAASTDFLVPRYDDDVFIFCVFYALAFLSNWFFWTQNLAVTVEAVIGSALFVWLLSGHRNYHIDAPKQVSSLTWKLALLQRYQVEPQHLFLTLGVCFALLLVFYFTLASNRPVFGGSVQLKSYGRPRRIAAILCPLLVLAAFVYYSAFLNTRYSTDLSRVTNGVGMDQNLGEGESNLGFHAAISPTKQPAALVRLEGDYKRNPWSPMLYLREGVLSSYNGRELVSAGMAYDEDVPKVGVGQTYFLSESQLPKGERDKVVQSVYLLTKHTAPFALDIPQKISILKNPYPERFLLAYQAVSYAPTQSVTQLVGKKMGDPSWNSDRWAHYLRAPGSFSLGADLSKVTGFDEPVLDDHQEDLRYLSMARRLAEASNDRVTQAALITHYLSEESIYTRNPGLKISPQGDPVAPYLFAQEKRGYCVHFSHAAVYMMRLMGIPARIATGYLIDLTYAKDGHILLQLGDRHAWPEVYVEGDGWTVFDINPARAENEPSLIPDENLLEDLMSKLTPAEILLEPIPVDTEISGSERIFVQLVTSRNLQFLCLTLLFLFLVTKLWLRYGYLIVLNPRRRVQLAYISFASLMADLGLQRYIGETRQEYAYRLQNKSDINAREITKFNEWNFYAKSAPELSRKELSAALLSTAKSYDCKHRRIRRIAAFLSPSSLKRFSSW